MKTNSILAIITAAYLLTACDPGSTSPAPTSKPAQLKPQPQRAAEQEVSFDTRVNRLRIGMSRSQVDAILGSHGNQHGRNISAQGTMETVQYMQNFGHMYATNLIRGYSMGFAGRERSTGVTVTFKNGRAWNINPF